MKSQAVNHEEAAQLAESARSSMDIGVASIYVLGDRELLIVPIEGYPVKLDIQRKVSCSHEHSVVTPFRRGGIAAALAAMALSLGLSIEL